MCEVPGNYSTSYRTNVSCRWKFNISGFFSNMITIYQELMDETNTFSSKIKYVFIEWIDLYAIRCHRNLYRLNRFWCLLLRRVFGKTDKHSFVSLPRHYHSNIQHGFEYELLFFYNLIPCKNCSVYSVAQSAIEKLLSFKKNLFKSFGH